MVYNLKAHSARLIFLSFLIIAACSGLEKTSSSADTSPSAGALEGGDILSICIEHKNLAFHIHMTLEIYILGKKKIIPKNTGISRGCMHVIHTHDKTGELHIESPYYHRFYLKDFFTIWGKTFNRNCIFRYCVDENHILSFFVNGFENDEYENLPLRDGDVIRIVYDKKK